MEKNPKRAFLVTDAIMLVVPTVVLAVLEGLGGAIFAFLFVGGLILLRRRFIDDQMSKTISRWFGGR